MLTLTDIATAARALRHAHCDTEIGDSQACPACSDLGIALRGDVDFGPHGAEAIPPRTRNTWRASLRRIDNYLTEAR